MAKVVIVDDDRDLAETVMGFLKADKHTVNVIHDGREALDHLSFTKYDVIVLDLNLPNLDGVSICKTLREQGLSTPIIMLTGKSTIDDKERGLDSGADDYVTKPFSVRELAARVRALLRRPEQSLNAKITFGDITLDTINCEVLRGNEAVKLIPIDFSLLEFLFRHPDHAYSAQALLDRVWHTDSEATVGALRSSVRRIRRKLDKSDDENLSIIENIPKVGYRLRKP